MSSNSRKTHCTGPPLTVVHCGRRTSPFRVSRSDIIENNVAFDALFGGFIDLPDVRRRRLLDTIAYLRHSLLLVTRSQDLGPSVLSTQCPYHCRLYVVPGAGRFYLTGVCFCPVPSAHQVHDGTGITSRTRRQSHRLRCQPREKHQDARSEVVLAHCTIMVSSQ